MNDPLSGLQHVLSELARIAAEAGSPIERMTRLSEVFASPRQAFAGRAQAKAAVSALEHLFAGVRYLVLNMPAAWGRNDQRAFIAVLRPDIQPPPDGSSRSDRAGAHRDVCKVFFFSDPSVHQVEHRTNAPAARERLRQRWELEWNRYARTTYDLQHKRIYTWNQFLLHACRCPRPIGLAWRYRESELPEPYVALTPDLAGSLGVPHPGQYPDESEWIRRLVDLDRDLHEEMPNESQHALGVDRWRDMEPYDHAHITQTAYFSVYHLLRSYAIWGGDAFVSLPVLLGQAPDEAIVGVLSLCTTPNLDLQHLLAWRAIAYACLSPVSANIFIESRLARFAAAWAHEVKNRTSTIVRLLEDAPCGASSPSTNGVRWALHGVSILNAVSFAIQRRVERLLGQHRIPWLEGISRGHAKLVVEAVFQYLLNYHAEMSRDRFTLKWQPRWDVEKCIVELARALDVSSSTETPHRIRAALTHPDTVCAAALLHEAVTNIRINHPIPGETEISVVYSIEEREDSVAVTIEQEHHERAVEEGLRDKMTRPRGYSYVNELWGGPTGMSYGGVEIIECEAEPCGGRDFEQRWKVRLKTRVFLRLRNEEGSVT